MSEVVPRVPRVGNTNPLSPKKKFQEHPKKSWCFTVFDYTDEMIIKMCANSAKFDAKYVFGREVCPDTEKLHLQCFITKEKKFRWSQIFKGILPDSTHREACKGSVQDNIDYCMKEGDYLTNMKLLPKHMKKTIELRPWQAWAEAQVILASQNDRKILWIYDKQGNIGKSVMVEYLVKEYRGIAVSGEKRHVLSCAFKNPDCPLWIFDIPRKNKGSVSFQAIEGLRNGLFFSGFGDTTGMVRLDFNPIIVVLCNELPKWNKLSTDRWNVFEIVNEEPVYRAPGYNDDDNLSEWSD